MFDANNFLNGLPFLLKEIDYARVGRAHPYYKNILRRSAVPTPAFFSEVDREALKGKSADQPDLTREDHAYLRLMSLVTEKGYRDRATLLSDMHSLTTTFPRDKGLLLTLAKTLIKNELYPDAVIYLERSLQLDEKCDFAWAHLALIAALSQDHGRTLYCARKALELGNHLGHTLHKAFAFTLLALGAPAKVGPFETAAHFQIEKDELTKGTETLPAVTFHKEPAQVADRPVVFFACDDAYFIRFGKNLLLSLVEAADHISIHAHIINPNEETLQWLDHYSGSHNSQLIVSYEELKDDKLSNNKPYLASSRFIHLQDFKARHGKSYLVVDADSILNNAAALVSFLSKAKAPVLYYSERGPIWDTISAPFTYLPNTDISDKFVDHVSRYLAHMFFAENKKPFWYVDQLALLGAYLRFNDGIYLCPAHLVSDVQCRKDAIFWTLSNDKNQKQYVARCKSFQHLDFSETVDG
jgi:tetratricopeptide (TPR) repeat protein